MLVTIALTASIFILNMLDWYTTRAIINNGGYEQNPLAKKLMSIMTMDGFLAAKVVFVSVVSWFLAGVYPLAVLPLIALYVFVIIHNFKSL